MKPVPNKVSYVWPFDGVIFGRKEVVGMGANRTTESSFATIYSNFLSSVDSTIFLGEV